MGQKAGVRRQISGGRRQKKAGGSGEFRIQNSEPSLTPKPPTQTPNTPIGWNGIDHNEVERKKPAVDPPRGGGRVGPRVETTRGEAEGVG
jgi:hypothetical protein